MIQINGGSKTKNGLTGTRLTSALETETLDSRNPAMLASGTEQMNDAPNAPVFEINTSRHFTGWLSEMTAGLAFTTYQVGKPDGKLWVFNRNIGRCLGLAAAGRDLWITADTQIYKFVDALGEKQKSSEGHDALYVPQVSYFTGDVDAHDIAIRGDGTMVFVNTLFNCIATVSTSHSFEMLWQPRFISRVVAEDRCHLNGLALRDGAPAYVTAISDSDTFDGWRGHRRDGGIVIDIGTREIVVSGLSMPHSPRWYRDRLWLHNSGTGEFGTVDVGSGKFQPVAFCPGYLRGLSFIGKYAVAGLSRPRENKTFTGLALDDQLASRRMDARCGLYVIDLDTGGIAHSLTIEGVVTELYDVVVLPGRLQPAAIGPTSPETKNYISVG